MVTVMDQNKFSKTVSKSEDGAETEEIGSRKWLAAK